MRRNDGGTSFKLILRTKRFATLLITIVGLQAFTKPANAQHFKVPEDPVQVVDAVTGETIPELLVMPLYSSAKGVFIPPEGPSSAVVRNYLDNPFVYRTGDPFRIKQPRGFIGLPLLFIFIGKAKDLDGILVIARNYYPLWTDDLWGLNHKRKLRLSPIPHERWLQLMKSDLSPVLNNRSRLKENCEIWQIAERCDIKIKYSKKERELVRSFIGEVPKENQR